MDPKKEHTEEVLSPEEEERRRIIEQNRMYNERNYERIEITVAKGARQFVRDRAKDVAKGSVNKYLKDLIDQDTEGAFYELEEELKRSRLRIDDDGNYYDPLDKDMDNDGVKDRYDHDFRDGDYEESTFDIDGLKKNEKPSILGQIKAYQSEGKNFEKSENKENTQER